MSSFPCTQLISTKNIVIAIYGPYIHVIDSKSGKVLQANSPSNSPKHPTITVSSAIRNAAVSPDERRLATVDDEKQLKVWDVTSLDLLSSRELPKKACQVLVTNDGQTILVADKFGDVFSYPIVAPDILPTGPRVNLQNQDGRKSLASHENPSLGTLILGHTSSLISMLLTPDEKFVLTSDRDEHIRVSHYPRGHNIERYCLGHEKYVSALHISKFTPTVLISGGGDRHLFFWNYITGVLENKLEIWDIVYSMTKVGSQRRKYKRFENKAGTGWRARKRRERELKEEQERKQRETKKQGTTTSEEPRLPEDDKEMQGNDEEANDSDGTPVMEADGRINTQGGMYIDNRRAQLPSLEDVIVVSKIDTLRMNSQYALIFTAVGANAVFFVPYDPSSSRASNDRIHHYTLPSPVLDIAVPLGEDGNVKNRLWVSIDSSFESDDDQRSNLSKSTADNLSKGATAELNVDKSEINGLANNIYLLEWRGDDTMIEVAEESEPVLCTLLNLPAIQANTADLQALDLYALLTTLPKTEELEEPEASAARPHELDVSMDNSVGPSLDERAGRNEGKQTASGQATLAEQRGEVGEQPKNVPNQTRAVKKEGRKKWQAKMEMRTKTKAPDDSDKDAIAAKENADIEMLPAVTTTKASLVANVAEDEDSIPMETEESVHEESALRTESGKRKAIEKEDAEYSEGHISKRLKMDEPQ